MSFKKNAKTSDEALGLLTEQRAPPAGEVAPNLLELLPPNPQTPNALLLAILKILAAKCTIYFAIYDKKGTL